MSNVQEKLLINQQLTGSNVGATGNSFQNIQLVQNHGSSALMDPEMNVGLTTSSTHHLQDSSIEIPHVNSLDSSSRSTRRVRSMAADDNDFQVVSNKKTKSLNNQGVHSIRSNSIQSQQVTTMDTDSMVMNNNIPIQNNTNLILNNLIPNDHHRFISSASARYALTRFPFPPHIVRFNTKKISICLFKEEIIKHFKSNHNFNIDIVNCRSSSVKCSINESDILLYVKDSHSFALLLDPDKWPLTICGESFHFPSSPSIPPQLSLMIKNVDLRLDFDAFTNGIKQINPCVKNVIRMKNKFGNYIKLVKIELTSPAARDELLRGKHIHIDYIRYEIDEYLSPVNVLICSKCCGLGHFRRQCTEPVETCKSCGQSYNDRKDHHCAATPRCKHCNGEHLSNSMKCPVIKSFRSELTRKMLNINQVNPSSSAAVHSNNVNNNFNHSLLDFPRLGAPWATSSSQMDSKLNDLISGLAHVNKTLSKLCETNTGFLKFINDKNERDLKIDKEIEHLKTINGTMVSEVSHLKEQHQSVEKSVESYDRMFKQFLFPVLDDILKGIGTLNIGRNGKPLDADLRSKLDRFRAQVSNAIDGKIFV